MQPTNQYGYTREYCEKLAQNFKQGFSDRVRTMGEQESLLSKVNEMFANLHATPPQAQNNSNDPTPRRRVMRIPLQRRAIENPTEEQIIFWAFREGIAQRMSPHSTPTNLPFDVVQRCRRLYQASLERWHQKNDPK